MQFQYTRIADWPPLAWLARCVPFEHVIEVFHGDRVDVTPDWFCEAIWAGPYDAGDFDRTDVVFGSGCRRRGARATFVSSASTVDRLQTLEAPDGIWVSNSLACLLAAGRAAVDPLYPRYFEDFRTIRQGLLRYRPSLASSRGAIRLTYYGNLDWDGGRLQPVSKPAPLRDFGSFAKYRAFLGQTLQGLAGNMGGRERRRYEFLGTISTGYDSPTVAVLAREAGLSAAITVDRSRGGASDSGEEIATRLGLPTHVVERDAWRRVPLAEIPFIASDAKGEDVYFKGAEERLVGKVLLTGYHGDGAWSKASRPLNADIVRKDQSGLSLSEYRLWVGFIHCPVPFLGIRQLADINAISRSPEMARWDWPRGNSRPICRRIVEEAGLPRHLFGMGKRAASVLLFDEEFLGPESLADYTGWLADHTGDPRGPASRPGDALLQLCGRLVGTVASVTPRRWSRVRAVAEGLIRIGKREPRFRYVFPWALDRAERRYGQGLTAAAGRPAPYDPISTPTP
ncbi:MAG TPA: hypothetical protein VE966_11255 [Gemmatimonadales bacterium]|nr:hypothetical protein [Gemmatimonadales bacterium]